MTYPASWLDIDRLCSQNKPQSWLVSNIILVQLKGNRAKSPSTTWERWSQRLHILQTHNNTHYRAINTWETTQSVDLGMIAVSGQRSTCTRAGKVRMRSLSTSARSTATSCACALARSMSFLLATMSCRRRSAPVSLLPAARENENTAMLKSKPGFTEGA